MDLGRIIQMIVNQLLRRAVNTGVNAAIRKVSGGGKAAPLQDGQSREAALAAKRARQAARLTRKL